MEELLDTYFNYKMLKRNLKKDIWDHSFDMLNRKYEEVGEFQPFMYLFVSTCTFFVCLYYSIPYILENIVIGKRTNEIYATPEELAQRRFRMTAIDNGISYNEGVLEKRTISIKETKQNALNLLRKKLTENNNVLKGTILSTKFPKISEEELVAHVSTGKQIKPLMVQRITFGNDINKAIKILFNSSVKHRKIRNEENTYLVFENETVVDLEKRMQDLFMTDIKIKVN